MGWAHILSKRLNLGSALPGSLSLGHYVFAFVFLVRLIALTRLTLSPLLLPSGGDMHFYDDWARQIVHGRLTDHFAFYGLPLYAYLLALLYKVFGYSPFVPGFLQAGLDAGTATLLYKIAVHVFRNDDELIGNHGKAIGIAAAASWAFFVPAQVYSVILMPTTWFVFVFWFLVWQIVKAERAPSSLQCLAYGALIGITSMGIATILFIVPLVIAALLLKPQSVLTINSSWAARGVAVALLFLGIGAGTAPCWIHNCLVARDPVFLSAHGGINLWLGNNPDATGYPHFPGLHAGQSEMLRDSIDLAEAAAGRSLKRSEVSDYWSAKARTYIRNNFGAWLKLIGRKLVNFASAFEYDDISIIDKLRNGGVVLPGLHFGLVAAFAFPGACLSIWRFPATRWIVAAILLHLSAVLPVFVTERYRLAVVPGLILFAAAGVWMFWESCSLARGRIMAGYLAALVAAAVFVTWPQCEPAPWALKFYNSGAQALDLQDWNVAQKHLELAHAYVPDSTEVNLALGNLWLQQQNLSLAEAYYLAVLRVDSRHKAALSNLAVVALSGKEWEIAANFLRAALDVDPNDAKTHYLYARAQFEAGHMSDALSEIQIALRLRPGQREFEDLYELIRRRQ
jgi:tetratricopeptide (TPR) repeat protein